MKSYKPLLTIFAFVGLLWACETTDPFVNEVQLGLISGDYDMALAAAEEALELDSLNSVAHYYKAITLGAKATSLEPPEDRLPLYQQSRGSFDAAIRLMESAEEHPSEYDEIDDEIIALWAEEINSGIEILNDDSLFNSLPDPNWTAIAHFKNAATIQPDSALTYQVMSSTYFQEDATEEAIDSYEQAMALLQRPEVDDYEYIISLYLFDNQYQRAIELSEEARTAYPEESTFVQFLADAYIQSGERDHAISIIQDLIASDPDNPQYRRVLGTQVYQSVDTISEEVSGLYEEQFELRQGLRGLSGSELEQAEAELQDVLDQIDTKEAEIDELVEISISEMRRVTELEPESESAHFILGIIFQNRAANFFDRRNNTTDNDEARTYDELARENLKEAMVYYEKAAEINPDNPENWQSLFQIYTNLNMEEEAQEAMERAGFND